MAQKKPENMQYEEVTQELQNIVNHLETGELPLEDALKQFERGISLANSNSQKLQKAQQQVNILLQQNAHAPLSEFDPTS
ncbi:MAG TPA: exodeoxyribonuclease VII small subunit [Psychromonas hadalis]|nr:exodeoxyribonuclease VII small subunit [Psychromonas hadalis]